MKTLVKAILGVPKRIKLLVWALTMRVRLARYGIKFQLEAGRRVTLSRFPTLEIEGLHQRGGSFRLVLGDHVWIGPSVDFSVKAGVDNVIIMGNRTRVNQGVCFKLSGGTIEMGEDCRMREFLVLKATGHMFMEDRVSISYFAVIHCEESIHIGEESGLGERITVVDSEHIFEGETVSWRNMRIITDPVVLGKHTLLLTNSVILMGARLGPGCVVGAQAVVKGGDYPASQLLAGTPAKSLRTLHPEPE
ncbi:MAG: hypothetical protein QOG62_1748 [Thermoleophilaceae bacterium]|jgi:acetyltransferase-like isoleucine patch superfamily enzyme|nr:hypothetical protein [Thermoleophilaceae bacterium]